MGVGSSHRPSHVHAVRPIGTRGVGEIDVDGKPELGLSPKGPFLKKASWDPPNPSSLLQSWDLSLSLSFGLKLIHMTRGRNEWIEEGCFGCAELVGLFAPPNEFDAFKTRVLASVNFPTSRTWYRKSWTKAYTAAFCSKDNG